MEKYFQNASSGSDIALSVGNRLKTLERIHLYQCASEIHFTSGAEGPLSISQHFRPQIIHNLGYHHHAFLRVDNINSSGDGSGGKVCEADLRYREWKFRIVFRVEPRYVIRSELLSS